jgi:hypothetical protein
MTRTRSSRRSVRHDRRQPAGLIAFVWRSENTRVWLKSAGESDVDSIVRRAAVQEWRGAGRDDAEVIEMLKSREDLKLDWSF